MHTLSKEVPGNIHTKLTKNTKQPIFFDEICDAIYDYVEDDGYNNLGNWIESAAKKIMENKIEHLKMVQNTISRMSTNSFNLKGWSITLITGLVALHKNSLAIISPLLFYFHYWYPGAWTHTIYIKKDYFADYMTRLDKMKLVILK